MEFSRPEAMRNSEFFPAEPAVTFARRWNIPLATSRRCHDSQQRANRLIDVGRVTFTRRGEHESRYFLGVASFGMSADVIARVKEGGPDWLPAKGPKWLTGRFSFGVAMLQTHEK